MTDLNKQVHQFVLEQQEEWPLANRNYTLLFKNASRTIVTKSYPIILQYNAERIRSSAAKIDASSLKKRPCFLCPQQLPLEQRKIPYGIHYHIMLNPYPIFPEHLTIPCVNHTPQKIAGRLNDMLQLAKQLYDFIIFYNGPFCGASAPDHMHFQAGNKGILPAEKYWSSTDKELIAAINEASLYLLPHFPRFSFLIKAKESAAAGHLFNRLYNNLPVHEQEEEPMMNVLSWMEGEEWLIVIIPRQRLRPSCYYALDESKRLISPASVEMAGLFVLPREQDFLHISINEIQNIMEEVCLNEKEIEKIIQKIQDHDK